MKNETDNLTTQNNPSANDWAFSKDSGEAMNRLVRGEISAVEAYTSIIEKIESKPELERLHEILATHQSHVNYFKKMAVKQDKVPDYESGAWGNVVSLFVGSAKLFGNTAALKALKEGEEHGLNEYQKLLENEDVPNNVKVQVREKMMPTLHMNINSIDAMMKMQ